MKKSFLVAILVLGVLGRAVGNAELLLLDQKNYDNAGNSVWNGTSDQSFAVGNYNKVDRLGDGRISENAYIFGRENVVSGSYDQVLGLNNKLNGSNSVVIGNNNTVNEGKDQESGHDVYILGSNVNVATGVKNAIVLGNKSVAVAGALSLGGVAADGENISRKIVNVKAGDLTENSNEVVVGSQLFTEQEERKAAYKTLETSIKNETLARQTAVQSLDERFLRDVERKDKLITDLKTSVKTMETNISNETLARQTAVQSLDERFLRAVEKKDKQIADLTTKITEEAKEREKGITAVNEKIAELETIKADKVEVKKLIDQKVDGLVFENSNLEVNRKLNEVKKEVASAVAMANIPGLDPGAKFALGAAFSTTNGNSAFAMGVNGKLGNFGYKASLGIGGVKNINFGAGVSYNFGKVENENKALNEKVNKLEQELNELKNMLKK
ncbi:YadA-like family protein [Streptobacillus canis]|uniref:YadA-like family protein n=1 Tax=Streptobacillus canis TaxID=2678686 RepID=UPI0012E1BA0F|nr:YadA-like family protein [Streptobacillus canis]